MNTLFKFFENIVNPFLLKPKRTKENSVLDFLKVHSEGYKKYLFFVAILSACTAIIEIQIFQFIGKLVDNISAASSTGLTNESQIYLAQTGLLLFIGLFFADSIHTLFCNQTLEGNFRLRMISSIHKVLMRQDVNFFQLQSAGKVANTLSQTADAARNVMIKLASTFTFALVFTFSMVILLSAIDFYLLIPVFFWFVGYIFVVSYFIPKLKKLSGKQAGSRSEMVGQLVDTYSNITTVKLFSDPNKEMDYAKKYFSNYWDALKKQMRFLSGVFIGLTLLNAILIFGTIIVSILLWEKGLITVGVIAAATTVSLRIYTMSHWIMWEAASLFNNLGVIQDGVKLFSKSLPECGEENKTFSHTGSKRISFKDVEFSYSENKKVIKSFSLDINANEKIGLIGRSGSGKSTLTKILLRFLESNKGRVEIDGIDHKLFDHNYLLENISVVTQEVELLNRSVKENLMYGQGFVSENQIIVAAKAAEAHDFILELIDEKGERGYNASIGVGGARLSGGQRQRIAIARAIIKNSPILIFDEATSAIDVETEARIMRNIKGFLEQKTVIVITHRLNGLVKLNKLVVIDGGELIELGTHEELMLKGGLYSSMLSASYQDGVNSKVTSAKEPFIYADA